MTIWRGGLGLVSSWTRDHEKAGKTPLSKGCLHRSDHAKPTWLL